MSLFNLSIFNKTLIFSVSRFLALGARCHGGAVKASMAKTVPSTPLSYALWLTDGIKGLSRHKRSPLMAPRKNQ